MNSAEIEKFYTFLQEMDESYRRLSTLLSDKLDAVSSADLAALDHIMKEEQVYVLQAKSFDANLASLRSRLGVSGDTLGEVIEELPETERPAFRALFHRLRGTLDTVQEMNGRCQKLLEERLSALDRSIRALDKSAGSTYRQTGADEGKAPGSGLFTKQV